jgi:hypothetical protein
MKKISLVILAFLFSMTLSTYAQPKLQYENLKNGTFDWGNVKSNQTPLKTKIMIKNVGDKQLDIQRVKPGCGCTAALVDKSKLNPGEVATIDVSLNLGGMGGSITKSITVTSNDPKQTDSYIYLKANVIRDLEYFPNSYFTFSNAETGKEAISKLVIKNKTNHDIKLKSYTSDNKAVTLKFTENMKIPAKGEISMEAILKAQKSGPFFSRFIIKTNDKENSEITLDVHGNIK